VNRYPYSIHLTLFAAIAVLPACAAQVQPTPNIADETRIIPDELYKFAASRGCKQPSNYYVDRPAITEPPFVYGILASSDAEASSDFSAAVLCEPEGESGYSILLKLDGRQWPGGCVDRIGTQLEALGLSVIRDLDEPLEPFWDNAASAFVSNISSNERTHGPAIRSMDDGFGYIYYCHKGRWLSRPLDW
jgi:hypothetical protein